MEGAELGEAGARSLEWGVFDSRCHEGRWAGDWEARLQGNRGELGGLVALKGERLEEFKAVSVAREGKSEA